MYIVTGGAGFIGGNIIRELNRRGRHDIIVVDDFVHDRKLANMQACTIADCLSIAEFRAVLAADRDLHRVEGVFHQGACTDTTVTDRRLMLDANFTFSKLLLKWALRRHVPLVYASSAAVYGSEAVFKEEPANERPLNIYGGSKLLFDRYVRRHCRSADSTVVGLRYFNVYGPGERHKGKMASMVYQLHGQVRENGVVRLFKGTNGDGDGEQRRDFVHVSDVVAVNLFFMDGPTRYGIYNVGTGQARSFNDVARLVAPDGRIEYIPFPDALRGKYQDFTQADLTRLRQAGYATSFIDLQNGIDKAIRAWQREDNPCCSRFFVHDGG